MKATKCYSGLLFLVVPITISETQICKPLFETVKMSGITLRSAVVENPVTGEEDIEHH